MTRKTVLVAGATGLVGYAAMKHFGGAGDCDVIALSRRRPDESFGARFISLDLTDGVCCAAVTEELRAVTHLVYAALHERPGLVAGWREQEQIETNDRMLRNLLNPLAAAAPGLQHVTLLQGTKAYGVHVRPLAVPARENRSEMHDQANFYWNQENYVRAKQAGQEWAWSILRPVLIVGEATGSAMNVISALGAHAALREWDGFSDLPFPGGAARVAQAVDADVLARAIAWAGGATNARNEIFNVTNGDVFVWQNIWPAIAEALGMRDGGSVPMSLDAATRQRGAEWDVLRARHGLRGGTLDEFVGLSFEYADYTMGYGRGQPGPPALVSTIKLQQAGFHEVMDTEAMFRKWFALYQDKRLLPSR